MEEYERRLIIGITPNFDDGKQHLPERYVRSIEYMGGEPLMIRFETPFEDLDAITDGIDGMLFSGGADVDPFSYGAQREPECGHSILQRDHLEKKLLEICLKKKIPVFGICRGCQIINVALGGTLLQDIPKRYGTLHQMPKGTEAIFWHSVRIEPSTMMFDTMGGDIMVDSYHHQCVSRLGDGLIPTAYSPEGFIEAFELPQDGPFLMAVQWHPEVTLQNDENSRRLFDRFREAIIG